LRVERFLLSQGRTTPIKKMPAMTLKKIVSGGQTGADLAAWDAAMELDFPSGGWVPRGRTNEDGVIPDIYGGIRETNEAKSEQRTEWNVRDSDATVVFFHRLPTGGSDWTIQAAGQLGKPCLHIDFSLQPEAVAVEEILSFLSGHTTVATLNVAGPKRSEDPLIYEKTHRVMRALLHRLTHPASDADREFWLELRSHSLENFRHWDQVRWLVPSWYATLAAVFTGFGLFGKADETIRLSAVQWTSGLMTVFGVLCIILQACLMRYHDDEIREFNNRLAASTLPSSSIERLKIVLPFGKFNDPGAHKTILKTATCWFYLYLVASTGLFAVFAFIPKFFQFLFPGVAA
jgi:hypothetical protein